MSLPKGHHDRAPNELLSYEEPPTPGIGEG